MDDIFRWWSMSIYCHLRLLLFLYLHIMHYNIVISYPFDKINVSVCWLISIKCFFFPVLKLYFVGNQISYSYNNHPSAHLWGKDMGCLLWVHSLTWALIPLPWHHNGRDSVSKSPAPRLFTQPFIQAQIKETSKLHVTGLCVGNSPGPVNSPHKWPVTWKMFPFDDVVMQCKDVNLPVYEIPLWRLDDLIIVLSPQWDFLHWYDDIFILNQGPVFYRCQCQFVCNL